MVTVSVHLIYADPSDIKHARFAWLNTKVQLMFPRGHQVGVHQLNDRDRVWCCGGEELDTIEGQIELERVKHREFEGEKSADLVVEVKGLSRVRVVGRGSGLPGGEDEEVVRVLELFLVED